MFYDNKKCDGCSELMLEGEDIVVCPECGTPQHRECYQKNNECVNAHLHAEGFDWRAANVTDEKAEEPSVDTENEVASEVEDEESGKPRIQVITSADEMPDIPIPEFHADEIYVNGQTVNARDDMGGATVKEIVTYTQVNSRHYLKRFARNKHKKSFFLSWNWGAFFFGPVWFFYRKLYKAGAIMLALAISAAIAVVPFESALVPAAEKLQPMYQEFLEASSALSGDPSEENQAEYDRLYSTLWTELKAVMPKTALVLLATAFFPRFIPALIANYLYRRKMLEDIKFAREATTDEKILRYSLLRRGGVSLLAGIAAEIAYNYLPLFIMSFIG